MAKVSKMSRLCEAYKQHISLAWRQDLAPERRVIFCIYEPKDERRLLAHIGEFEIATRGSEHGWLLFELENTFAEWLSSEQYAETYYQRPTELRNVLFRYRDRLEESFGVFLNKKRLEEKRPGENSVVALSGLGSIFGLLGVKEVVDRLVPLVEGRLVVFFPGSHEKNQYRLLDRNGGWNYLATPISAD